MPESEPKPLEEDIGERLDKDYTLGCDFKDELIPMAYEYFLNVIDHSDNDSSDDDDSYEESHSGSGSDSKRSKKKKNKEDKEKCQ